VIPYPDFHRPVRIREQVAQAEFGTNKDIVVALGGVGNAGPFLS
jgi:hypothetical protein